MSRDEFELIVGKLEEKKNYVEKLVLKGCELDDCHIESLIGRFFNRNEVITQLDLSENKIQNLHDIELKSLVSLNISKNHIKEWDIIANFLQINSSIKSLQVEKIH